MLGKRTVSLSLKAPKRYAAVDVGDFTSGGNKINAYVFMYPLLYTITSVNHRLWVLRRPGCSLQVTSTLGPFVPWRKPHATDLLLAIFVRLFTLQVFALAPGRVPHCRAGPSQCLRLCAALVNKTTGEPYSFPSSVQDDLMLC